MTFFEKELHRLFDDSERISDDTVFAGKTMIADDEFENTEDDLCDEDEDDYDEKDFDDEFDCDEDCECCEYFCPHCGKCVLD